MPQKRFFILDETCPASEVPSMMCRVVIDKLLPLGNKFAPLEPPLGSNELRHNPQDIIPDILPAPVITTDQKDFLETIRENKVGAALTPLGFEFSRSKGERLSLESQEMRRYTLSNPDHIFNQLMKNELYARDVQNLLAATPSSRAYLVVGFVTTTGAIWKRTHTESRADSVVATIPTFLSGLIRAWMPELLGPRVMPSSTTTVTREHQMRIADEGIIAVSYCVVKTSYGLGKKSTQLIRKTPVVGPPKRVRARHLAFSGGDSDEEIDESLDEESEQEQACDVVLSLQDEVSEDGVGSLDLEI